MGKCTRRENVAVIPSKTRSLTASQGAARKAQRCHQGAPEITSGAGWGREGAALPASEGWKDSGGV